MQYRNQSNTYHLTVELVALDEERHVTTCTGQTKSPIALDMVLIAVSTPAHLIPDGNVPDI